MHNLFTDNLLSNPINEHETAKHPFSRLLRSQSRWKETHEGHRAERREANTNFTKTPRGFL